MRPDRFEIGIEREYALYVERDGAIANVLANDRLLAAYSLDEDLRDAGWRLAPEYSKCLVELASPPHLREEWDALLEGFARVEAGLARAAASIGIECTAAYSFRTDRFVTWDGEVVTRYADLLLDPSNSNDLLGGDERPPCLAGCAAELAYAGFTSTNATLHAARELDVWALLRVARAIEIASPQRHPLLRDGRDPIAPDPDLSIRDALIRWADPRTAALLDAPAGDDARFRELCASRAYSCRPRIVDGVTLYELRCFHSGLPLAKLAPLLEVG